MPWSAQKLIGDLDRLFARAGNQGDLQVQSDYAQYLVVRVNGLMECVAEEVVLTFARAQSSAPVSAYVASRLKYFQNPEVDRLVALMRAFSQAWSERFKAALTIEEREAIGSVWAHRNKIAHGESTTISLGQLLAYYGDIKAALVKFAEPF